MITQTEIARSTGLDVTTINKVLNRKTGPNFRKKTIEKVFQSARDLGYDFGRLKFNHRRRYERNSVKIRTSVTLFRKGGHVSDQGHATVSDISHCGARIVGLMLRRGYLPVGPLLVVLQPQEGALRGVLLRGRIVRVGVGPATEYGVDFEDLNPVAQERLHQIAPSLL